MILLFARIGQGGIKVEFITYLFIYLLNLFASHLILKQLCFTVNDSCPVAVSILPKLEIISIALRYFSAFSKNIFTTGLLLNIRLCIKDI